MGIESWSTSAGSNNQAPPNGWPGGMLPSQVEPTARQMMASLAVWYQAAQWINYNFTPVYISNTQFSVASVDVTGIYQVGRRVQATDGSTSVFGTVTASAFTTITTVTVAWDTGVLQTGVTIAYVGIVSSVNTSAPALGTSAFANPSGTIGLTANNGIALTAQRSDATPALSQAIAPTWTNSHVFSAVWSSGSSGAVSISSSFPLQEIGFTGGGTNAKFWWTFATTNTLTFAAAPDSRTTNSAWMTITRSAGAIASLSFGNAIDNPTYSFAGTGAISGVGSGLTALNGSNVSTGTVADARLSENIPLLNAHNVFSASGGTTSFADTLKAADAGGTLQTVGWRGTPINTQGASYTLVLADQGKTVLETLNGATVTVPASVFSAGDVVAIAVGGGNAITVAQGSGLTLEWVGNGSTTGSRTLTGAGLCTVMFFSATVAFISGGGLS